MAAVEFYLTLCGYLLTVLDIVTVSGEVKRDIPRLSAECMEFEVYPESALYGYNNHIVNDVYLDDCNTLCISQTLFLCASYEYNQKSGTCFLSADDIYTQPRAFGSNRNTNYYQRFCADASLPSNTTTSSSTSTETRTTQRTVASTRRSTTRQTTPTTTRRTTRTTTASTTVPSTASVTTEGRRSTTILRQTSTQTPEPTTTTPTPQPSGGETPSAIAPEFYGVSFLELVRPNHVNRLCEVSIEFTVGAENGLILYMGDSATDFLSLAMQNGHLEFRYDTGTGVAVLKSRTPLELNQSHIVEASRLNRQGRLLVNDQEEVTGESPEGTEVLNTNSNVFVGFVPPELYDVMIQQTGALLGMAGCIHSLTMEGMGSRLQYDLDFSTSEDVIQVEGVGVCGDVEVEVSACDLHPCNHGTCVPKQQDDYDCVCQQGYTGKKCESLLIIDVLDHVQVNRNDSVMAWINCIGRSTLDPTEWTIRWYQNHSEILDSMKHAPDYDFVRTEYETDLLGAEKLFVAQLYFPHIAEANRAHLRGNYTCELVASSPEPLMRKTLEIVF